MLIKSIHASPLNAVEIGGFANTCLQGTAFYYGPLFIVLTYRAGSLCPNLQSGEDADKDVVRGGDETHQGALPEELPVTHVPPPPHMDAPCHE